MMDNFQTFFNKEVDCIGIIHEFLVHYEFKSTLPVFIQEAQILGFQIPEEVSISNVVVDNLNDCINSNNNKFKVSTTSRPHIRRDDIKELITSFENKNYKLFFKLWQNLIPQTIRESNLYRELTFYLYVYFATMPFRETHDIELPDNVKNTNIITIPEEKRQEHVQESTSHEKTNKNRRNSMQNYDRINKHNESNAFIQREKQINNTGDTNMNQISNDFITNERSQSKVDDNILVDVDKDIEEIKNINSGRRYRSNINTKLSDEDDEDDIELTSFSKIVREKKLKKSQEFDEDSLNIGSIKEDDEGETNQNSEDDDSAVIEGNTDARMLNEFKVKEITNAVINEINIEIVESQVREPQEDELVDDEGSDLNTSLTEMNNSMYDECESAMDILKTFLTTKGPEFSSEPEFLPFFALPFINNPNSHPSFMEIFKESWVSNMEQRLIEFIQQYSYGSNVTPSLMRLCSICDQVEKIDKVKTENNNDVNLNDKNNKNLLGVNAAYPTAIPKSRPTTPHKVTSSPRQNENTESDRRYKNIKWKFQKLHRDHQNLIGVAAELTSALENSVRGQAVDLKATLNNCVKIFPELFARSRLNTADSAIKKDSRLLSYQPDDTPCYHLDVQKIKQHLATGSIKAKLLLLQAVRWRLTHTAGEERDQTITWISQHDVLSIRYPDRCPVLEEMLITPGTCTPHPLQQAAGRLLNTIASLHTGRDYLSQSNSLLMLLITTLRQDGVKIDQSTSDMLLATLQKLSLRRNQRIWMIEENIVKWLAEKLKSLLDTEQTGVETPINSYTLEYSTALLMNLSLHEEARERFPVKMVSVIVKLLDTTHTQIIPVVAGTLYCLLTQDNINEEAKENELEKSISRLVQKYNGDQALVRQFDTLLKLHKRLLNVSTLQSINEDHNEDDTDDPDELEQELDLNDPVRAMPGDLSGDDLLNRLYSCPTSVHGTTALSESALTTMSL